ncbi:hypothetical protein D3C76_1259060 [compost metagenome]
MALGGARAAGDGQVSAANASGLFDERNVGEAATVQLPGSRQPGDACPNDANSVLRIGCPGDAVLLFNQLPIIEA